MKHTQRFQGSRINSTDGEHQGNAGAGGAYPRPETVSVHFSAAVRVLGVGS